MRRRRLHPLLNVSRRKLAGKKGSFTVYALMLFIAVLIAVQAFISAALHLALGGAVSSLGSLWGRNVLAEYDLFLLERYGLFAFWGYDALVEEKLALYAGYSFDDKDYIELEELRAELDAYGLCTGENLKEQIEEAVLFAAEPKAYGTAREGGQRSLKAGWIRQGLPSCGKTSRFYLTELVNRIKEGLSLASLTGHAAVDAYIMDFFKHENGSRDLGDTYFSCEVEYIISGELSDEKAAQDVKSKMRNVRNLLNLFYLYTCAEKRQAVMALAQALTPGPAALITQAVMMETWAYLEAENDIDILYSGKTVPLLKKDCHWALSLENVFGSLSGQAAAAAAGADGENENAGRKNPYIAPKVMEGEDQEDYLRLLLAGLPEETKLLRIADLIQINAKYLYCDSFLLAEYYTGLNYTIRVNGYEESFSETY